MNKEELIAISRHQALTADNNPEDTLFIQLTRREIWMVIYGQLWAGELCPDLVDTSCDLLEKLGELLDTQRPEWRTKDDGTQAA